MSFEGIVDDTQMDGHTAITIPHLELFVLRFQVYRPLGSGEEAKNRFSRWHSGHLGFPIGTILAIFDLHVTPMLPT